MHLLQLGLDRAVQHRVVALGNIPAQDGWVDLLLDDELLSGRALAHCWGKRVPCVLHTCILAHALMLFLISSSDLGGTGCGQLAEVEYL